MVYAAHRYWLVTWPEGEHRFSIHAVALLFAGKLESAGFPVTVERVVMRREITPPVV
jgi:hypothetical protein